MFKEVLGSRLKDARTFAGLTQKEVANILKLKQPTIASYESGRTEPDIETLGKLAQLYDVSVDYLIGLGKA